MRCYRVWSKKEEAADSYWVLASGCMEARRLVALNCEAAQNAERLDLFGCEASDDRPPPHGLIRPRTGPPIRIARF
jgi:hypothetical protein